MADFEEIMKGKYPAKAHCQRVADYLKSANPREEPCPTQIYLQGQQTRMQEDNDEPQPFRQRRGFFYLSGCALPDCHLTYHIPSGFLTLFIPPLDPDSVIWSGLPLSPEQALEKYDIDLCLTTPSLRPHLEAKQAEDSNACLALDGRGTLSIQPIGFPHITGTNLHTAIDSCRVVKDEYEIALLRKANEVTTAAHIAVLKSLKYKSNEGELEAVFLERCRALGAKEQAYSGIFGSGTNAATLHYQANDQPLAGRQNLLVDAGAEWECYCADVTRTMPLSTRGFSTESDNIYRLVQGMQQASFDMLKAGVKWEDVHTRAHEVATSGLMALSILSGTDLGEAMKKRTSVAFFPHGLGHYLGMDTHDTGGNPNYDDKDPMFRYLRVRGTLPDRSVITVEPGIYFCRFIIEPYLHHDPKKHDIDERVLERYWDVGGVRIEDDILITQDGYENLTTAPKEVEEMLGIMNGGGGGGGGVE